MGKHVSSQELVRLGCRIRECRQEAGMSQEELAEKAEISPVTVSRIECGLTAASVETLRKLVQALGLDAGGLFCGEEPQEGADAHIREIVSRVSRMEQGEQRIVAQTVRALADALEKNR